MPSYTYFIEGKPVPEGSLKAFPYLKKSGGMGVAMTHQNPKLIPWRDKISKQILEQNPEFANAIPCPKGTEVQITVIFSFLRPKTVSVEKRPFMTVKPDLDKCIRSVGDALSGIIYEDDCQIIAWNAIKQYVEKDEGVYIKIDFV